MINFAEDLIYWYLRFNGFFLLRNFVLHRVDRVEGNSSGAADFDLLAIRFPHVYEEIGGHGEDWDREQFKKWGIEIDKCNLAFIVEVTSSKNINVQALKRKFSSERLKQAIRRFGIFLEDEVSCMVKMLEQNEKYIRDQWVVAKLVVTEKAIRDYRLNLPHSCLNLLLNDADKFIQKRIKSYSREKYSDRIYFPDALIQYLAWKK